MGDRASESVAQFVERFADAMVEAGMPRMPARLFAVLLTRDDAAATAAELAGSLQTSAGSVSGAVKYLTQVRLIARERRPGERFDRYRLHSDVWYEAMYNRDDELARWADLARQGVTAVGTSTPAGRRLGETADFFDFVRDEMPALLERWRARRDTRG
jgi:DNA-binding transcriptional regulator GbsR (MarR family)